MGSQPNHVPGDGRVVQHTSRTNLGLWRALRQQPMRPHLAKLWNKTRRDRVSARAAELAYFFLLSLFPLLLFLTTILGLLAATGSDLRGTLLQYLQNIAPVSAYDIIAKTLDNMAVSANRGVLSFAFVAALWSAARGMRAVIDALDDAYDVHERGRGWRSIATGVALTLVLALLTVAALVLMLYGEKIGAVLARQLGFGEAHRIAWSLMQWIAVPCFVLVATELTYRYAPDIERVRWRMVTPGAIVAVVLWMLLSMLFRVYLLHFHAFGATYGSVGAVIVLMVWMYLSGASLLIGGEVNAILSGDGQARVAVDLARPRKPMLTRRARRSPEA
jgi:membrane protein